MIFATGFEVGTPYTLRAGYEVIGLGDVALSAYWQDGIRTFNGMQSRGFPNCFFVGSPQSAITINATHSFNEQAKTIAQIVGKTLSAGHQVVEPSLAAETAYVDEVHRLSGASDKYNSDCTPGYYNSEGKAGNTEGIFVHMYGGTPVEWFEMLKAWRDAGRYDGLEFR